MATRTATLIIRFKTADGTWKRALAASGANGRIRPGYALVNDNAERVNDFNYQVRFFEKRRLRYESAGKNAADAEFSDINRAEKTFRVQGKPRWGFKIKTHEQRDVPVPDDVLAELDTWQSMHPGQALILGTKNRKPNMKLLRAMKRLARQAKLNCGRCEGCQSKTPRVQRVHTARVS